MDFTIFYKTLLISKNDWQSLGKYDLFISCYDCSERAIANFERIDSDNKHWLLSPHHKIATNKRPTKGTLFEYNLYEEDEFIVRYFNEIEDIIKKDIKICVDITGFIRPFIIYLIRYIQAIGIKKIEVIYTEPNKYLQAEDTEFSGYVDKVKPVPACIANDLNADIENDVLILATGYDDKLISAVSEEKKHCNIRYQIYGFPSLQPDMYQESVLRAYNAKESLGLEPISMYSPAFDPFVTAQVLKEIVDTNKNATNFYISPLSTKPQVLGFILYFIYEGIDKHVNIIFPYSKSYSTNTCQGVNKTWHYLVELP